jgi:hypothetical protein
LCGQGQHKQVKQEVKTNVNDDDASPASNSSAYPSKIKVGLQSLTEQIKPQQNYIASVITLAIKIYL